ncbi:MAG: response regulator transcription factor [Flavobacteriales bacterium]|nr:response regulator transcription factor [Flavobacteriales bacterium]
MKDNKILIVEDEQVIAENLRFILNEYGYHFVDVAMDVSETKQLFKNTAYQLVLMDINLGETSDMDGVDLIKYLSTSYSFSYIYVTANADEKTVQKTKDTQPAAFIVKPFTKASIYANVEIALNKLNEASLFTYVNKGMQQQITLTNISHIEADGAYINIHTTDKKLHLVRMYLSEFNKLYPAIFVRIHKSILVNKNHIQAYTSKLVIVQNQKLPLGRAYKLYFAEQTKELSFS